MKLTAIRKILILKTVVIFAACSTGEVEQTGQSSNSTAKPTTERSSGNVKITQGLAESVR